MDEKVVCNKCGREYTDQESIDTVKRWLSEPVASAPCPNLSCTGQLEIGQIPDATPASRECSNCGYELTSVWAARSVELEWDGEHWIEKNVFSSAVSCPNCHEILSDEKVSELGIEGY